MSDIMDLWRLGRHIHKIRPSDWDLILGGILHALICNIQNFSLIQFCILAQMQNDVFSVYRLHGLGHILDVDLHCSYFVQGVEHHYIFGSNFALIVGVLLAFLNETSVFFLRHYPFVRQTLDLLDYELAAGARQIYIFFVKIFELVVLMVNFLGAPEFCLIVTFDF
jgi:hypothetical protein